MYCPTNYSVVTADTHYQVIGTPATGASTVPVEKFKVTADNAVSYPILIKQQFTVVLGAPESEEPRPRPVRKPFFQPSVREIVAPWQAKWRLRQQRPRDGLHS